MSGISKKEKNKHVNKILAASPDKASSVLDDVIVNFLDKVDYPKYLIDDALRAFSRPLSPKSVSDAENSLAVKKGIFYLFVLEDIDDPNKKSRLRSIVRAGILECQTDNKVVDSSIASSLVASYNPAPRKIKKRAAGSAASVGGPVRRSKRDQGPPTL